MIQTFPDNKIVEDDALRLEARGNKNDKLTPSTTQSVCMNSGVLESRGISHEAEVTESEFIQSLGESGGVKEIYLAKAHMLPEENINYVARCQRLVILEHGCKTILHLGQQARTRRICPTKPCRALSKATSASGT